VVTQYYGHANGAIIDVEKQRRASLYRHSRVCGNPEQYEKGGK
jgi:hypothetical protein